MQKGMHLMRSASSTGKKRSSNLSNSFGKIPNSCRRNISRKKKTSEEFRLMLHKRKRLTVRTQHSRQGPMQQMKHSSQKKGRENGHGSLVLQLQEFLP